MLALRQVDVFATLSQNAGGANTGANGRADRRVVAAGEIVPQLFPELEALLCTEGASLDESVKAAVRGPFALARKRTRAVSLAAAYPPFSLAKARHNASRRVDTEG